jgi:putative membrane protein
MSDIIAGLGSGLPVLLLQFSVTALLLVAGVLIFRLLTPFNEQALINQGNAAAATVSATTAVAIALPLAATLATSTAVLDIVIWGSIGLLVQVVVFVGVSLLNSGLKQRIEAGELAAAITLGGWQIAFALLNAAALAG